MEREPIEWTAAIIIGAIIGGEIAGSYGFSQGFLWLKRQKETYTGVHLLVASGFYLLVALLPVMYWICRQDVLYLYALLGLIAFGLWFWIGRSLVAEGNERKHQGTTGVRFHEPT